MRDEQTSLAGQNRWQNAPGATPRFHLTAPAPCPYLPGKTERKIFTELGGPRAGELAEVLGRQGFRRSQNFAYRPACESCRACVPVRIPVRDFHASATQRRLVRAHADLTATVLPPWTTEEQYALLRRYLLDRHPDGGMSAMDGFDYADMVEQTRVDTRVIEYRQPGGALVAACITDQQDDGLSMIYSFYDSEHAERHGLGTWMILDHVARARAAQLDYVYLGFWIEGAPRMAYKSGFHPIEMLVAAGWERAPGAVAGGE